MTSSLQLPAEIDSRNIALFACHDDPFVAGQEPDKDCSGSTVAVSKLPYYLQRPFYQPKELEPTLAAPDASAQTGEGGESPAPPEEPVPPTSTAPQPPPPH